MKKILLICLLIFIVSCGGNKSVNTDKKVLYEVLTQQTDGGGNIHFFEILTEPNEIKMLQNDPRLKNKININDVKESNFIILNMGEKPTGGYSIGVESIIETSENIVIAVKENNPEPGAMVTQGITYPYCVVKINSKKQIVLK
jgi:hypothetical protein